MLQKSFTSASKEKRGPSLRTTLVQKSRVPNGDESSEDSPSSFSFQRTRKKLSESKPFSTFSSRKKREDEVNNGQLKPRMRNTIYISPYANPYKTQRASSGIEKYQTESTNELQNSTEDRQIENDGSVVESTPGNSSTETITVERIETVQEPDDITMDDIQYIGGNSFGEDSIPYFGNLFNIDKNETNIDENDMMAVVEVGRPIFVTTSSDSGRRRPLSQASELGRTSTQEITGISELLRSLVSYDLPGETHIHRDSVFTLPRYIATFEEERCALKTRIAAYKDSAQNQNKLVYNLQKKLVEYKSRITELETSLEGRDGRSKCSEVHQISQILEQEQSRVTSLVSMNSALREQLSKSQASNTSLSMELEKLTTEWQETKKLLNAHDMETQIEDKVSKEIKSAEHVRLLSLWEEVLKVRRSFVDTRSDIERQLKQIQMDFSTSVKNTSGSLANLMALTGCEYCTEGDGLTTCWQRIKGLQSDINRVTTEKDSLNAQLEILKIENRGLVSRLRDRDTLVQNLNKTIDHLQEQNNRSSEEVGLRNRIQEELDHTKHVLREVHRLLAEDTDENSDSLELKRTKGMDGPILPDSVVTMLRSVMDKKQLQIHDYQLNIENERQQFAELNRTIATLSCEREALQQDLQALRQDFTVTSQRCEELSKQRDSCNSILESTTKGKLEVSENCRKLMKDLENLRREKASFQLSVTGLSLEKSQWIEEKESLQSQIRRVKSDCAQLESQNTTLREACEDLKHGLAQARAEIQRMSIDRNLIEGQKKDLALNLQNCEKKKLELESDISRYKSEIQLLRDQITRFEQTNLSLSKEKSHIEQLLKEAETEKVSIEHILDELKADFSAVKEELVKTERARSQLEIRYDTLQETLQMTEVDRDKYLSDLQDAEKVKEELSTQLIIAEREKFQNLADLEARSVLSGGFEQEIGRLKIERTGLEAKIRQLETKLATTEDSLKSQQDINGSISSTRQQIELSLYAAQSEIDSLQEKANRLQGQVEETIQEKNQLRFQLTSAERSNEARFGNARKEIEELTELISKRNDELKKLTHEKDSISLSLMKEKEKLCQSFESQLIDLRHRFNRDKEDMMSTQTEELRHLRQQMSLQARKFDENLEAAELDKQQSLKFARSEQQAIETRLQKALTELEVSRAEVMKVRSESANRTSSDRLAMTNLRNELNKLQDELVQESSRHAEEISILEKKHTDALQALELAQSEATQLKCSVQSALLKNESTLEKMAELERQLEEALDREQSLKVEMQKIQNQLSATVKENDSILSSNQELKAQIRDLGSEGNELQGTIDEQRHKISLLEDTKLKLEEELNIARNMMNVAEKRIIETETTFSENNRSIGSLKAKLQNLYNDLETNEARLQAEKSRSELAETQVNELNDQLKGALNKCDNLERDVLSIRRALALKDDSYKSQEEELRRKMQELAAKVKRLEDEKNNLELKFGTNVEEISQLSQKLRTAEERCETMQALSKKLEEQKNDIALRLASVMSSLKKVTGVTDKLNIDKHPPSPIRRLAQFKSDVIASEGISGRSSESIKDIDTESVNSTMRDLVMQSAKLEKERDDSISNNQILERKVGELNEKISQSEETIIQLKNALGKANCEHKTLQQHISSLENTLKEKESSEAMKTQMVTTSEEKLQVLEGKQRALLEEKGTLEDALNKVKLKLVQNEYEIRRLNQQIEAAQFKLNKSETGRKSLEQELNRVQKLLRDKEMEYQALQSKSECLQQNIVRLQERCDTLQSQVDKLQASEEIYKNRELNLKEQLTRLNVSASQENSALSQLKEQTLEYQRQLTSMEAEKRVTEERLEMMRSGNSELRRENSHLHEVIASLKTEVSSLKTKVVVLEGEAKNTQLNLQSNQERTGMVESDTMQRLQKSVREKQDLQERVNILTRQLSQVEKEKWDIARQSCSSKFDINRVGSEEENFLVQSLRREIARMADRFREMERDHTASFEEMRKRHKQERMRDAERMRELQISAQRQAEARERALKTRTEALERQVHYLRMQLEKDASMSDLKNVVKNSLRTVASEPRLDSDLFKREISKLDNALSRHLSSSNMPS